MKKISLVFITLILIAKLSAQVDKNGNPIFNSEVISEDKFDKFELTSSYYTIKNNIDNKNSSVFVSEKPTLEDYISFARNLPATFFIVHKGERVICMIILLQKNDNNKTVLTYNIFNPGSKKSIQVPCNVWGEISEKRAEELLKLNIDTTSRITELPNNGKGILFNGITYRIQPYEKLRSEILEIANQLTGVEKQEKSSKNIEEFIRKESIGGQLDFSKTLDSEKGSMLLHEGIAYSKKDFSIYMWAKTVKKLGVESSKRAIELWQEINSKELTSSEKKALEHGFDCKE